MKPDKERCGPLLNTRESLLNRLIPFSPFDPLIYLHRPYHGLLVSHSRRGMFNYSTRGFIEAMYEAS